MGQASTRQILPETHLYTEGNQVLSGVEVGGLLQLVLRAAPLAPGFAVSQAWVRPRGTRWAGWAEGGTFLPCADWPRRAPAAPGPALWPPPLPRRDPGRGGLVWAPGSLDGAEARPAFQPRVLAQPPRQRVLGGTRCQEHCSVGWARAASRLLPDHRRLRRPAVAALAQRVTCPPVTQPGVWGSQLDGPALRTAALWPYLAPSPAQLTRPAVW